MKETTTLQAAGKQWLYTWVILTLGLTIYFSIEANNFSAIGIIFLIAICACIGSLTAFVALYFVFKFIQKQNSNTNTKLLYALLCQFVICLLYGLCSFCFGMNTNSVLNTVKDISNITLPLFASSAIATYLNLKILTKYFQKDVALALPYENVYENTDADNEVFLLPTDKPLEKEEQFLINNLSILKTTNMQTQTPDFNANQSRYQHNKTAIKAFITGALILIMLIPTAFISSLISEREQRQKEVVTEVSAKWAFAQTVTGPYLVIPYKESFVTDNNKTVVKTKNIVLLPENLSTDGKIQTEERPRSIYKVLLYKSDIRATGNFKVKIPTDIVRENLVLKDAKLCIGINDFRGIEGPINIRFNGADIDLTPGLPTKEIDENGLSATVGLTAENVESSLAFSYQLKLKGSERLSFVPLAGNSRFTLSSPWPNPSFDGNTLPSDRKISDKGFSATWNFNKANLPFGTFLKDFSLQKNNFSFGVSMLQPADQYAKTMRSVKYAILIIGLTFSLFFIVELMQKKPVHPVQYILVGLALVIFYTLLLSISEYIQFDYAYLISALATIFLISLYAKSHFKNWKSAAIFGSVLTGLYTFTFVLISLEDTSLIIGSIGLFIVLAVVMYASRKVNWYNTSETKNTSFETT